MLGFLYVSEEAGLVVFLQCKQKCQAALVDRCPYGGRHTDQITDIEL